MTIVGVAIGLGLVAPLFPRWLAAVMVFAGVLVLGWGLWGMSKIAIDNKAAKERPRVVANLVADAQGTWLDANV